MADDDKRAAARRELARRELARREREDPAASPMMAGTEDVGLAEEFLGRESGKKPPSGRSWIGRTGDRAATAVSDTLSKEWGRVKTPGGAAQFAAETALPLIAKPAATAMEFAEDVRSGNATKEWGQTLSSLPDAAKMAAGDPLEFFSAMVAGGAGDIAGIGARGRVRGEKLLGDTAQLAGLAAPLARGPAAVARGGAPVMQVRKAAPSKVDDLVDSLRDSAKGRRERARIEPDIEDAGRSLEDTRKSSGIDDAETRFTSAKDAADEAAMASDDFKTMQKQREMDSVTAREAGDNAARGQMRGAKGRAVDVERQLNAAVDAAFQSGRLSRQQKIALYDSLQGKRLNADLPPDLLDLAEKLREARIDESRFRAASLTDDVRDPMSRHGLAKTGPEGKALELETVRRRGDLRKARGARTEARRTIEPAQARLDELKGRLDPLDAAETRLRRSGAAFNSDPSRGGGMKSDLASWAAKQPGEGALSKYIGPAQMETAASILDRLSNAHPLVKAKASLQGMTKVAGGQMTADAARQVLEAHQKMLSDPDYRASMSALAPE